MKHLSKIGLAVLAAGVLAILPFTNNAKAEPHTVAGAVVFEAELYYENGYPKTYVVVVTSQGKHAPKIAPGSDLADSIETLLAQGFVVQHLTGLSFMATHR